MCFRSSVGRAHGCYLRKSHRAVVGSKVKVLQYNCLAKFLPEAIFFFRLNSVVDAIWTEPYLQPGF